jgi:gluconate 2-dehydrogenase gamma chain
MLGTVGLTCAFPFSGDELYGQHVHVTLAETPASGPYAPTFFTPAEYATLSRLTDVIIPATSTPGASAAGVPEYIDRVVTLNVEHQRLVRAGLAWLEQQAKERFGRDAVSLDESQYVAILQPLSDEVDRQRRDAQRRRFRNQANAGMVYYVAITDRTTPAGVTTDRAAPGPPVQFFRLVKNLTADGYYTSRAGLLEELGYTGNTALASFPVCDVREH